MNSHDIGICTLSEYDADGFIGVQVDLPGDEGAPMYELHAPYGFASRPMDGTQDPNGTFSIGCNAQFAKDGDVGHAWLGGDPRYTARLATLNKGESVLYSAFGNFVRCHSDGSVSVFTTDDATETGHSVYFKVAPNGFSWVAPWGMIRFDYTGFHLTTASGARLDLGGIAGIPGLPPPVTIGSYARLHADAVTLESSIVQTGADDGGSDFAVKATPMEAYAATLASAVVALQAAVAAIVPVTTTPGLPALVAAVAAAQVAVSALSSATTALPALIQSATLVR